MEHDDLERAQRMRYQMGLPVLAAVPALAGFEDKREGKAPFLTRRETTAMSETIVDRFFKAREEYYDRQLLEGLTATEMAARMRPEAYIPPAMRNREDVRAIMQELEWIREKEVQRMMCRRIYLQVVETEYITKEVQVRRHRKKRINKKWRKRYGMKRVPDLNTMVLSTEPSGKCVLLAHPKQVSRIRSRMGVMDEVNILGELEYQL